MFAPHIGDEAEKMTTLAGSAAKPAENRKRVLNRLIPTILPYELHTRAAMCRSRRGLRSAPSSRSTTSPTGHLTRYGVPTTWLAGLARLPSGPTRACHGTDAGRGRQ